MDRNKILERIQKALNMANDGRGDPNEMATALHQAQAMMRKYEVTEEELGVVGYGHEVIRTTIQCGKKLPQHLNAVAAFIGVMFGCRAIFTQELRRSDYNYNILYFGRLDRVAMATYTHQVLWRAIEKSWARNLEDFPQIKKERGARVSFFRGFLAVARKQVSALALTEEEQHRTELAIKRDLGDTTPAEFSATKHNSLASKLGILEGSDFKIHRPVSEGEKPLMLGE